MTEPRPVAISANQTLDLSLGRDGTAVRFAADITTENGYVFQHQLSAPSNLEVESISVRDQEGVERAARWSREPSGTITIFLTGPVEGRSQLQLLGSLRMASEGESPLPRIDVAGGQIVASQISIFRQPDVLVRVEGITHLETLETTGPLRLPSEQDRLVARFRAEGEPDATLVVAPNEPQVSGVAVTTVELRNGAWEATLDYRFNVRDGVADVIRMDVPRSWSGPYQVEPAAMVTNVGVGGEGRQVIVRPREGMTGESQLRIRGPLAFVETERPAAPNIVPRAVNRLDRFLILPTTAGEEAITWETRGVVPEGLPPSRTTPDARQTYRVVDASPRALLRSVRRVSALPSIVLADVRVALAIDGSSRSLASFDLEPAGLVSCELRLADGHRLIQATVAGLPSWPQEIGPGRWQLILGPRNLPQRIEIVSASASRGRFRSWSENELHAPRLLVGEREIGVELRLWTVFSPSLSGTDTLTGIEPTTAWRQELSRLQGIAVMIDLGADLLTEQGSVENARWFQRWARRFHHTLGIAERRAAGAGRSSEVRSEMEAIIAAQPRVARWLRTSDEVAGFSSQTPLATEAVEIWKQGLQDGMIDTRYDLPGGGPTLKLSYAGEPKSDLAGRLAAALLLGIGAGATIVALRRGMPSDILIRWPSALGIFVGLFWWLWLWPSVVGLAIVLLCLSTFVRRSQ